MRAKVYVTLKPGVHDPAGKAVVGGLNHLGFDEVKGVRIGKFFEIELDEAQVASPAEAEARLRAMCDKLLANTVIERYRVEIA